jgi:putative salt-induced outer membrane protein YdiY
MRALVVQLLFVCTATLTLIPSSAFADQVVMKNGDRFTGMIVSSDGKSLVFKTDYSDSITVKWDAVDQVTSDKSVFVTSKAGQVLNGTVRMQDGNVAVESKETGHVAVARADVAAIRSPEEQRVYQGWSGGVDMGLSLARGNTEVTNFSTGAAADRTTLRDKTSVYFNSLFARNRVNGATVTTANALRGGVRFDYNLGPRAFAFAFTDLEHDRYQLLDLSNVIGGGLGYHAIKTEQTTLDLNAGASLNQEFFTTLHRRSAEALAGDEFTYKLSGGTLIQQRFEFFPNLSDLGQYRLLFDLEGITKINNWLGWQVGISDRYISNPVLGTKGNDVLVTSGLRFVFGGRKL